MTCSLFLGNIIMRGIKLPSLPFVYVWSTNCSSALIRRPNSEHQPRHQVTPLILGAPVHDVSSLLSIPALHSFPIPGSLPANTVTAAMHHAVPGPTLLTDTTAVATMSHSLLETVERRQSITALPMYSTSCGQVKFILTLQYRKNV